MMKQSQLIQLAQEQSEIAAQAPSWWQASGIRALGEIFVPPTLASIKEKDIELKEVEARFPRAMIVGGAGSGKTMLFSHMVASEAKRFLGKNLGASCPVFIRLRELEFKATDSMGFVELIAQYISKRFNIPFHSSSLADAFSCGKLSVFLDGYDELHFADQPKLVRAVEDFIRTFPSARIWLSSRPSAISVALTDFSFLEINYFDKKTQKEFAYKLSGNDTQWAQKFLDILSFDSRLEGLSGSPLFLTLLWHVFEARGEIHTNPTFLYADITDFLLSTWERQRGVSVTGDWSLEMKHRMLEEFALYQYDSREVQTSKEKVLNVFDKYLHERALNYDSGRLLYELLSTGLIHESGSNYISFAHLSFLEYYAARALVREPRLLVHTLANVHGHPVVLFACGLIPDVAPIIEAALEKNLLILAAKCISNGRTKNIELARRVAEEFEKEIGTDFLELLMSHRGLQPKDESTDPHGQLLKQWQTVLESSNDPIEKGRSLESFANSLFSEVFTVVNRNVNTENGEVDLLLENHQVTPFWLEFGGDIFVECKNWNKPVPLKEVGAFSNKANQFNVRLAFFLSVSGFTADAERLIRNQAQSSASVLVVPIDGSEVEKTLKRRVLLEEFFKDIIRRFKYLKKY